MGTPLRQLQKRSASSVELVLAYADAMIALDTLESSGASVLGWEGWLRHSDGRLGHSAKHQGTVDLSGLSRSGVYTLCRTTIRDAHAAHLAAPEALGADLLFCLTHDS